MNDQFENIPVEEDTAILFSARMNFGELSCLHQKWVWDNIGGESVIFADEEVADLTDAQLESLVRSSPLVRDEPVTISRGKSEFSFVNFNFTEIDD